jgi:alpha-tubulin suppressor-like RCC1 family protein
MGEGWTGALGTGSLDQSVPGHDDEEELMDAPALVYPGAIKSAAAGWGHSAIVTKEGRLFVCGRPHDFSTLLRLKRLPSFLRNYAAQHALRYNDNDKEPDSLSGRVISWMMGDDDGPEGSWRDARRNSILPEFIPVEMPAGELASSVVASAGLTAVLSDKGRLYTFGLNHHGQCGIGKTSNNVWTPEPVIAEEGRAIVHPITNVAIGLQHGIALDTKGNVFLWGKGERGQLGLQEKLTCEFATPLTKFRLASQDGRQRWTRDLRVTRIAAGMNHSAICTDENLVFVWGKNMAETTAQEDLGKPAVDAMAPMLMKGLPQDTPVQDIACGSHHTAVLLEDGSVWAVGFATDNSQPILEAVEVVPPGMIEMPCLAFCAHFDRTTVVGKDGSQVLQVHLWGDEALQEQAVFKPAWCDLFQDKPIQSVHRGWLHTLVVTKD